MTKQDKIKKWLDENGYEPRTGYGIICRAENKIGTKYSIAEIGDFLRCVTAFNETPIGLITPENAWIPAPKFEDDIEAPVALPKQERGKRFEPEKFVPDDERNVLLRFQSLVFTGFLSYNLDWHVFAYDGAILELKRTPRASETFTWEEL